MLIFLFLVECTALHWYRYAEIPFPTAAGGLPAFICSLKRESNRDFRISNHCSYVNHKHDWKHLTLEFIC
ncbi:hypothetical protein HZ326_7154 [Fusarium oxysporum f. sp. albedinis]|nr:hypothetical protein HZ326_7154 [Fusarium oxysporum f. sp. albedinis]